MERSYCSGIDIPSYGHGYGYRTCHYHSRAHSSTRRYVARNKFSSLWRHSCMLPIHWSGDTALRPRSVRGRKSCRRTSDECCKTCNPLYFGISCCFGSDYLCAMVQYRTDLGQFLNVQSILSDSRWCTRFCTQAHQMNDKWKQKKEETS